LPFQFDSSEPIYTQIVKLFKQDIARGKLSPGEKVAPVRELALSLGVNPNTVQRALAELERDSLLYSVRTSGRFVTTDTAKAQALRQELAWNAAESYVSTLYMLNYSQDDILDLTREALISGEIGDDSPEVEVESL